MNKKRNTQTDLPPPDATRRHLNVRVSSDLLSTIRRAARFAQIPLSAWIRDRLLVAARREIRVAEKFSNLSDKKNLFRSLPSREENDVPVWTRFSKREMENWIDRLRNEFSVAIEGDRVVRVRMLREAGKAKNEEGDSAGSGEIFSLARREIEEFIGGARRSFDIPLDLSSLTPFCRDVLSATSQIPYGETRSYKWVAAVSGRPKAVRAVGQALHRNPIPILIP